MWIFSPILVSVLVFKLGKSLKYMYQLANPLESLLK